MDGMGGGAGVRNCSLAVVVIIAIYHMIVAGVEEFSFCFWTDAPIDAPVMMMLGCCEAFFSFKTNGSGLKLTTGRNEFHEFILFLKSVNEGIFCSTYTAVHSSSSQSFFSRKPETNYRRAPPRQASKHNFSAHRAQL